MKKKYVLNLTLFAGLMVFGSSIKAQTSINAASNRATIQGNVYEYSIGEMTLISTEHTGNLTVTQGYLQPSMQEPAATTYVSDNNAQSMRVYPNPTQNILNVESIETVAGKAIFDLYDASGKVVIHRDENLVEGLNKQIIDFSSFAAGSYFLLIKKSNSIEPNSQYSFKVQKTN